jgi:hypothetical protein
MLKFSVSGGGTVWVNALQVADLFEMGDGCRITMAHGKGSGYTVSADAKEVARQINAVHDSYFLRGP